MNDTRRKVPGQVALIEPKSLVVGQTGGASSPALLSRLRPILLLIALLAAMALAAGCFKPKEPELPVPLADLIPVTWQFAKDGDGKLLDTIPVNIDEDDESEYMILYRYDNTDTTQGPVGGVIYDAQPDAELFKPDSTIPIPYQPSAFLVPYRLLPDWRLGKGQGYLADSWASWAEVKSAVTLTRNDELNIYGHGPGGTTRLSIFWWVDVLSGYDGAHFQGSGGVDVLDTGAGGAIQKVRVKQRQYDRSNMCARIEYTRNSDRTFTSTPSTLEFCQGTPAAPTYPEAVVLAWLLGRNSALLMEENRQAIQQIVPKPQRITDVTYEGYPQQIGDGEDAEFWYTVYTTVETNGEQQTYWWRLQEIKPIKARETTRWEIHSAVPSQ